ncbi:DUF3021 domain-containing protein [Fructobacillus ficulneus]|uniref:DUF3021 domain-containing protein n=1 Tax=Fructobacillus ficulneus TaxID=157463 RepID=A0A0K8MKU5_9LACO|nr:DUF3021 domain-containing protein [Fructobacillus ficulneus]GAP00495.1 hypothetical protein FFIC_285140 [Fructobacillus ficulneus]
MKNFFKRMTTGAGYGATAYLLILFVTGTTRVVTNTDILAILIMSALIGLLTFLFRLDSLSYLAAVVLHFFGTLALVLMTQNLAHSFSMGWQFWLIFVTTYVVIWLTIKANQKITTDKINHALQNRNQQD